MCSNPGLVLYKINCLYTSSSCGAPADNRPLCSFNLGKKEELIAFCTPADNIRAGAVLFSQPRKEGRKEWSCLLFLSWQYLTRCRSLRIGSPKGSCQQYHTTCSSLKIKSMKGSVAFCKLKDTTAKCCGINQCYLSHHTFARSQEWPHNLLALT